MLILVKTKKNISIWVKIYNNFEFGKKKLKNLVFV